MTLAHQGSIPCLPIVLGACQKKMFIMLHCMSLAGFVVFLFYLVFAIDCMFVIDFDFLISYLNGTFLIF